VLVDPRALARGEVTVAIHKDMAFTAGLTTRVTATRGTAAQVRDPWEFKAGRADWTALTSFDDYDGRPLGRVAETYGGRVAGDRPRGPGRGLAEPTRGGPAGAARRDYAGWVGDTGSTATLRFAGPDRVPVCRYVASSPAPCTVLAVDRYQSTVDPTPIRAEPVLSGLPGSLPPATIAALAATVLPAGPARSLDRALASLTGPVPVDYTYQATAGYAVEPATPASHSGGHLRGPPGRHRTHHAHSGTRGASCPAAVTASVQALG
jgi:hypothetical protein